MKRRLLTLAVILFGGLQLMAQEAENIIDEIIWVVGDEAILRSEVENERKRMLYQGEKIDGDPYGVIPEQMAIQKLFINQAIIDSIEVSDEQVEAQVDAQMNMFIAQIGSKEKLEEYLEKPISQLRSEWRTGIRNNGIMQQMQQKLVEDVTITPSEVRLYFERLPKDSIPFIETNSGESEFSTLAILYSEDPGSAAMGGELGFKAKGAYVPEFSAVAFQLTEPGKVSKVVETEFGYHIIQLIERRGDRANFRHILLTPKVSAKELTDARARMDTLRMDLDSAKFTFEEAARYLSSDKNTRNSGGMMTSERSGAARMTMDELPAEVARVVARMEVGEISKPFVMKDSKTSRDQVAIVKLRRLPDGEGDLRTASASGDYRELHPREAEDHLCAHQARVGEIRFQVSRMGTA